MPNREPVRIDLAPEVIEAAAAEARRAYRLAMGGWALVGAIAAFAGVSFFVHPESVQTSAIGRNLEGPADEIWNALWTAGGFLIALGVLVVRRRLEAVGQLLFLVALTMDAVAVWIVGGSTPSFYLTAGVAGATAARIGYLLLYGPVQVTFERRRRQEPISRERRRR